MDDVSARIAKLNANAPTFVRLLGGSVIALDTATQKVIFTFIVPLDYCHSVDVVQGGFVTAMLDAAMSHALFGTDYTISNVATLDIATQFLDICRGNQPLRVAGWVKKTSYRTAFLEAAIHNEPGELIATAQSVAKLKRQPIDSASH